jgi:uncharacterized protein (DUF305 family)
VNHNSMLAVVAVAIAVLVGGVAFAITRDWDHMDDGAMADDHSMHRMTGTGSVSWSGPRMQMGEMPGMQMDADGTMAVSDQAFIAMMIPHHQMAVEMARIELRRGTDAETKALARRVIADQQKEIAQMEDWYRDWFGTEPPAMPMSGAMAMMGMSMDPDGLETTEEPDRVFLRMMIPHHAGALLMADMLLASAPPGEPAGLARRIVAAQSAEIGQMQAMRERIAPPLG